MLIHLVSACIGLVLGITGLPAGSVAGTLPLAALALACCGRVYMVSKTFNQASSLLMCAVPTLMWLWYFSPAFIYTLNPQEVPDFLLFDEVYLFRSMAIMLGFFGLFTAGIEWVIGGARGAQKVSDTLGSIESLTKPGLLIVSGLVLMLGVVTYFVTPPPMLDDVENFIDVYEDAGASQIANAFASLVIVWALCVSLLVRSMLAGASVWWLLSAIPAVVSISLAASGTGRRQAVVFAAVVILFPVMQLFRRRYLPYLGAAIVILVLGLALVDVRRSAAGGSHMHFEPLDVVRRPLLNFANTTSFHARCIYYYEGENLLWGKSYLINPIPAVPLLSRIMPARFLEMNIYSLDPVRATVSFAFDRNFGMGGSPFSELFANFSYLGYPFALVLGLAYGAGLKYSWEKRSLFLHSLVASVLFLLCVWYVRSSLQGSIGMLRFLFVGVMLYAGLKSLGLIAVTNAKVSR